MRKILLNVAWGLALVVAAALLPGRASAQQATGGAPVAQQSQRWDAGSTLCATSTAVNATQATGTCTITPPAGQYVYFNYIETDMCGDGTASQSPINLTFTSTNLGGFQRQVSAISGSTITTNAWDNMCDRAIVALPAPLRSAAPGTAVTIVPPAQTAHVSFPIVAIGYFSP